MNTSRPKVLRNLDWLAGILGAALILLAGAASAAELAVIVNPAVPVTTLERKDLRAIFTLRRRNWPDGKPITIYVLPDSATEHQRFAKEKLRLYPYQLRQRWDRAIFSGTGQVPIEVANDEAMRDAVARNPAAIGYVENAAPSQGVKIVPAADLP